MDIILKPQMLPQHLETAVEDAKQFIRGRHAESTRRAYAADLLNFEAWVSANGLVSLPATPDIVALYLSQQAIQGKKPATLTRRLAAIRHLHLAAGHANPTDAEAVKAVMAGIRRSQGSVQRQVAPATSDVVQAMMLTCDGSLKGLRDKAVLALGFGGAFRRSELAKLTVSDVEETEQGFRVRVLRSKTDKEGKGQFIPVLDGHRIQVKTALKDWLQAAQITDGWLFRSIGKSSVVGSSLTDRSIAEIIKARATAAGLDPQKFSGHSLRSGFLTSAAMSGASLFKMMEVSRHKKVDTVQGYIRFADHFKEHAGREFM